MAIKIKCRKCEAKFSVKDAAAGRRVKCRECGAPIKVPAPKTDEEELLDFDTAAYGDEPSGDDPYGEAAAPETNVSAVSPLRKIISAVVLCVLAIVLIIEVRAGLGHMWSGNMLQENSPSGRFDNLSLAEFEPMLSFAPSRSLVREINGEIEYKYSWFSLLRPLLSRPEAAYYVIVSTTTPPHVRRFNTEPLTKQDLVGAAAAIWNLGGEVELDAKTGEVVAITLPGHQITYERLEHLKGLTSLRTLWLSGPQVPDTGLAHVKGLTSLKKFSLINTRITDAGLVHLKGLTSLTDLELDSPNITDAGLEHLKGLTSLTHLHLRNTNVTEAGLAEINAALPKCKVQGQPKPATTPQRRNALTNNQDHNGTDETVNSDQLGFSPERPDFNSHEIGPSNVGDLKVLWSNRHRSALRGFVSVIGEAVYYGDYSGEFRAVDAATGRTVWSKRLGSKCQGHAVVGGVAYVTSIKQFFAFDAVSGKQLWIKHPPAGQFGGPIVADGILYVGTNSPSTLHALNASTGETLWSVPGGAIAVSNGVLYKSSAEALHALNARTGKTLWQVAIEDGRLTTPAVSDGVVYVHSTAGKLYAFDATDREAPRRLPLWIGKTAIQEGGDGTRPPAVGLGKVFVGANSTFYAFDTAASEKSERVPVWTTTVEAPFFASVPSIANGVVYSTAGNHDIYAFDVATGKVLWNYHTRGRDYPMRSSPTIVNGRLYHLATFNFTLYAFQIPGEAIKE